MAAAKWLEKNLFITRKPRKEHKTIIYFVSEWKNFWR
jgi:hypothetical protein